MSRALAAPAAEAALLGACLGAEGGEAMLRARALLRPADFASPGHRALFAALLALDDRGDSLDLTVVAAELDRRGDLELAGGAHRLTELLAAATLALEPQAALILEAARRRALSDLGRFLSESAADPASEPAATASTAHERLLAIAATARGRERLIRASLHAEPFRHMVLPERQSLVEPGLIGAGTLTLLHGKPGTGKTTLALQLAVALSRGEPWHGFETRHPTRVGLLELELPPDLLQNRLQRIAGENGAPLDHLHLLVRPFLAGPLDLAQSDQLAAFRAWIDHHRLQLVILDALGRAHSLDQNAMSPLLNALDPLIRETGCGLLLLHHDRKGGTDPRKDGDDLDQARGDSRLAGDPATVARMVRLGPLRQLRFLKTWAGKEPDPLWFAFDDDGLLQLATPPEQIADSNRAKVLQAVIDHPGSSAGAITDLTQLSRPTVHRHLASLLRTHQVSRIGKEYYHPDSTPVSPCLNLSQ